MAGENKRKRGSAGLTKFYAVRVGRQPGIYNSWAECWSTVNGYPNAAYKSFTSLPDAQSYIQPVEHTVTNPDQSASWYAVRNGKNPGIYDSWEKAQNQVTGIRGARFKGFNTMAEAKAYMTAEEDFSDPHTEFSVEENSPATKKLKLAKGKQTKADAVNPADIDPTHFPPGEAPLPVGTEDGFDSAIILDEISGDLRYRTEAEKSALKPQAIRLVDSGAVIIHTDGSTLRNGRPDAISGVGVYFGPADRRNVSETLSGKKQTNQRAELTGIIRALELAPRDRKLIIKSDSNYAIQCVTTWFQTWQNNNWQTAHRKAVDNKDLVTKIIDLLEERMRINAHRAVTEPGGNGSRQYWDRGAAAVHFEWVKGHSISEGNQAADLLAVQGARMAEELDAIAEADVTI